VKKSKTSGVVVGGKPGNKLAQKLHATSSKQRLYGGVAIVIVLAGLLAWHLSTRPVTITLPTESQSHARRVEAIQQDAPPANAPLATKLSYYDELSAAKAAAGDYRGAIASFKTREGLSTKGLTYAEYYVLAQDYQQIGDKTSATTALDKAVTLVPPDDPTNGFSHDDAEANIANFRARLAT
jgi:tetratricopeptide (TPR) repeat protein